MSRRKRSWLMHVHHADSSRQDYTTYEPYLSYKDFSSVKKPLYLPYKPYEYFVDYDYSPGVRASGARYFRKRIKYMPVENPDFVGVRRHPPYERFHKMSDEYRLDNRSQWRKPIVDHLERTAAAKTIANFFGRRWVEYKDRKLAAALVAGVNEIRRKSNVEVVDLTGVQPRVYKKHRPINR